MEANKTVAYLAPEIPSVSGTFVYKEILALKRKGIKVIPISVHEVKLNLEDARIQELSEQTNYLYQQSLISAFITSWFILLNRPKSYFKAFKMLSDDIINSGLGKVSSWKLLYQFLYSSIVAKIILDNSCQYLHVHFAHVPAQIGMYASASTGIPFSFTAHANDIFENNFLLKEKAERAKAVITISEYNCKYLVDLGVNSDKLNVVRCGIDTSNYDNSKYVTKSNMQPPFKIGSLGRLIEKKGMEDLIIACKKLQEQNIDFQLEIGGDGPLRTSLEKLVKSEDLGSKIRFKGSIPNDEVFHWLSSLDVFVLACKPSSRGDRDGIPVVLMEAMYVGVPVISTNISGIPELIQDRKTGFLARPNDPDSLAKTMVYFLQETHSLSQVTDMAKNKIIDEFELDRNVDRLLAILNA